MTEIDPTELNQGGLTLVFACGGLLPEEPGHSRERHTTDLTSVFTGGTPVCTNEWCSHYEQDMNFLGWIPQP